MWTPIGYMGYKWSTRSVEQLPPFRPQKLRNQVLVMGNTVDPVTPIAGARLIAELFGDQAVLLEQLGIGHSTQSLSSSCTEKVVADHIMRGIVSLFHLGICFPSNSSLNRASSAPTGEGDQVQGRRSAWTIVYPILGRREPASPICGSGSMKCRKRK